MTVIPHTGPIAEFLFFSIVRIDTRIPRRRFRGTGFFFQVEGRSEEGLDGTRTFLVTNRHVLEDAEEIELIMLEDQEGAPVFGVDTGFVLSGRDGAQPNWHGHPDPHVDVAVIPLWGLLQGMLDAGMQQPHASVIAPHNMTGEQQLRQVSPLETVAFVGFPNTLYDEQNFAPIARVGTIATIPALDFEGRPAFLVDAPTFGGSSGSPLFLLRPDLPESCLLVGIVAEQRAQNTLGLAYKPWTINECIDDFHAQRDPGWSPRRADEG